MKSIFTEDDIEQLKTVSKIGGIHLEYVPNNTIYLIFDIVKVKSEGGGWDYGLYYKGDGGSFVRTLDQFPESKWSYYYTLGG